MKKFVFALMTAASLAMPVLAQQAGSAALDDMTAGEVRKVDRSANKVTIKHGEIKNLEMPPMTMVFQVKDPAMLDPLKAGDKVRFNVEKMAGGLVLTEIQVTR